MQKKYCYLFILIFLVACSPTQQQLADVLQKTLASIPTATSYPTYTIAPTQTAWIKIVTPTSSPTITMTPSPIFTPTKTVPPTKTLVPTATLRPTSTLNAYKYIASNELVSYANNHIGEKVYVYVHVFQIVSNYQIMGDLNTNDTIYIEMAAPFTGIYKGSLIKVYGTVYGTYSYTSIAGWNMTVPEITDAFYILQ